jgi:hypothetical protein
MGGELCTLGWSQDETVTIASADELDNLLRRLQAEWREHPAMAELVHPDGAALSIGLGRDVAVLSLVLSPDPPYFVSAGDPLAQGSLWFDYYGSPSEFPMHQAVDIDRALDAMRRFFLSGRQPDNLEWEEV